MIKFVDVTGVTTLGDHVKDFTFEQLKEVFEGKLDYVSLANQLGIKPVKAPKQEKPANKPEKEEK